MDDKDQRIAEIKERMSALAEEMPQTPMDAERKVMEMGLLEEELAEIYEKEDVKDPPKVVSETLDSLTKQIASITDELMQIEIKMLRADMENDEDQKVKLQMCASSLKARRQTLVDEVKEYNAASKPAEEELSLDDRVSALEKEVSDIKDLLYQLINRQ